MKAGDQRHRQDAGLPERGIDHRDAEQHGVGENRREGHHRLFLQAQPEHQPADQHAGAEEDEAAEEIGVDDGELIAARRGFPPVMPRNSKAGMAKKNTKTRQPPDRLAAKQPDAGAAIAAQHQAEHRQDDVEGGGHGLGATLARRGQRFL